MPDPHWFPPVVIKDLRSFVKALEDRRDLIRINEPLSVDLEVAALLRELMYRGWACRNNRED